MDTWILVYIIMGDKGADIPCAVATMTNNIIPTGVRRRRRRGITRPYTYLFISMGILYRCQEKKNSYTGQIPRNSLDRISAHTIMRYILLYAYITIIILMYILIIILYYRGGSARRMDGTAQHLVETKRARMLLCFNAFFHRRRRIIANMRTPVPIHIYLLYADPTNKTVCLLFLCSKTNCRAEHTHTLTQHTQHNAFSGRIII